MTKKLHNSELNGATPLETPQDVGLVVAEGAAPRRGRKAKLGASTTATSGSTMPDYAAFGIEEAKVAEIEKLRLRFNELGRRSTDQVFECGEVVARLQELAPDQESFVKLAKGVLGLSRRGAENYASVFRNLGRYRDRLVRTAMVASALYDLASAEPDKVEEVLAAREAGQVLSGKQIREMLGKTGASSASPDEGGAAGLRARIAEKTAVGVSALMDNAVALLEAVLVSLVPYREGKRIVVKDVQRPLIYPTRLVREQLEWLTWVAVPAGPGYAEGAIHHFPIVKGDRWAELHATLWKLGDFEGWPAAKQVGPWPR